MKKTNVMRGNRLVNKIWTSSTLCLDHQVTRALKRRKPQQKKCYKPVEGVEPSFDSIHCKLSYKFFEIFGDDNNEEYEDFEGFDIEDV